MAFAVLMGAESFTPDPAGALPPGRSWAATQDIHLPGIRVVRAPRLEVDSAGTPLLILGAPRDGASNQEWSVMGWGDSVWVPHLFTGVRASFFPEPVLSLIPGQFLVWVSIIEYPSGHVPLLFSRLLPEPSAPETVFTTFIQSSEYGAAVSEGRRWAIRSHSRAPTSFTNAIRVLYSDTVGIWRELPELGINEFMCTIAPLSSRSAIVAYSDGSGLSWAIAEGERWVATGNLDPGLDLPPLHPRFRFRPSGGLWLMWADLLSIHVSSYRDGIWDRGDSVTFVHPEGESFWASWSDMSRDSGERPVLAWGGLGVGRTFYDIGIVAFPSESGWAPGEEVPGSRGLFLSPKVTRDRNGDAWLIWDLKGIGITRFTHTYVSATTSKPAISSAGRHRTLNWTLSESAPETWWAVLRARGRGDFEPVARVRAGPTLDLSWTDDSPPAGRIRYKIRRESVDTRYLWESEEAHWPPGHEKPRLRLSLPGPIRPQVDVAPAVTLELEGAASGPLEVALYDLQGRLVLRQQLESGGTGQDTIRLDFSLAEQPLSPGIYFIRVQDAAGRSSDALKIAILK